ncbi:MAG: DUF2683 family protein [Ginsengibacter sp.]
MENILVMPENEKQLALVKAMLQKMRIEFRSSESEKILDFPELEKRIKEARKEKANGELLTVNARNLWENI